MRSSVLLAVLAAASASAALVDVGALGLRHLQPLSGVGRFFKDCAEGVARIFSGHLPFEKVARVDRHSRKDGECAAVVRRWNGDPRKERCRDFFRKDGRRREDVCEEDGCHEFIREAFGEILGVCRPNLPRRSDAYVADQLKPAFFANDREYTVAKVATMCDRAADDQGYCHQSQLAAFFANPILGNAERDIQTFLDAACRETTCKASLINEARFVVKSKKLLGIPTAFDPDNLCPAESKVPADNKPDVPVCVEGEYLDERETPGFRCKVAEEDDGRPTYSVANDNPSSKGSLPSSSEKPSTPIVAPVAAAASAAFDLMDIPDSASAFEASRIILSGSRKARSGFRNTGQAASRTAGGDAQNGGGNASDDNYGVGTVSHVIPPGSHALGDSGEVAPEIAGDAARLENGYATNRGEGDAFDVEGASDGVGNDSEVGTAFGDNFLASHGALAGPGDRGMPGIARGAARDGDRKTSDDDAGAGAGARTADIGEPIALAGDLTSLADFDGAAVTNAFADAPAVDVPIENAYPGGNDVSLAPIDAMSQTSGARKVVGPATAEDGRPGSQAAGKGGEQSGISAVHVSAANFAAGVAVVAAGAFI
ncbi:MAG: hypothetical protein BJ554DRAFT_7390 [Olpidium bornovanus]|uniref:Uncharacterized protein n=1 Tax=Olpidium bornovanus TaxID=278681 RepID=A0A8H8DJG7_9FUNG|nr:MAG: hypothetical protein BJ554DRAFT_7390 [Olpidium bornovanus]